MTPDGAEWLVKQGIKSVGVEPFGFEHLYDGLFVKKYYDKATPPPHWPAHTICLEQDVYILEGLGNLERIVGKRVHFSALPLPVPGSSGSPRARGRLGGVGDRSLAGGCRGRREVGCDLAGEASAPLVAHLARHAGSGGVHDQVVEPAVEVARRPSRAPSRGEPMSWYSHHGGMFAGSAEVLHALEDGAPLLVAGDLAPVLTVGVVVAGLRRHVADDM